MTGLTWFLTGLAAGIILTAAWVWRGVTDPTFGHMGWAQAKKAYGKLRDLMKIIQDYEKLCDKWSAMYEKEEADNEALMRYSEETDRMNEELLEMMEHGEGKGKKGA